MKPLGVEIERDFSEVEPQIINTETVDEIRAESSVGEGDLEPLSVGIERDISEGHTDQNLEPGTSSQESLSEKGQVSRPVSGPRRCTQKRKPVERLNLVQVVDLELFENVRQ